LHEPHTRKDVRLGTVEVRAYIGKFGAFDIKPAAIIAPRIATHGPEGRYNGVLYIEKEGFMPQIERARIAERYDIAIVSDEGMSTVAARQLIDEVCGRLGKPLFTMHDFDITGLDIQHRIFNSNNRYQFRHEIGTVIDFGLRLTDVNERELQSEPVDIPGDFRNLSAETAAEKRENWLDATEERLRDDRGATEEEIEFLLTDEKGERGAMMKRVELNALDAQNFVAFIEAKLEEHGLGKVMPDSETLADVYAFFARAKRMLVRLGPEIDRLNAEPVDIPDDLADRLGEMLEDDPETSWDATLETLADADGADYATRLAKFIQSLEGQILPARDAGAANDGDEDDKADD
jgi:hypothetical protein